jgi:hypothetical protein
LVSEIAPWGHVTEANVSPEPHAMYLCDEDGVKTGDKQDLRPGLDPKIAAINLLRGKIGKRRSDFTRPLRYSKNFY